MIKDIANDAWKKQPASESKPLPEQLISVVVDNVTGKHYQRKPKWIRVEPSKEDKEKKFLYCEEAPNWSDSKPMRE
jgi:hypothetical protein